MPRRREVPKREILPDPKYHNTEVAKFVNVLMTRGKKSVAERIIYGAMDQIQKRTGKETRSVVLGHLQRGGSPTNMDRALCTIFGAKAVDLIAEKKFGQMVAYTGSQIVGVSLADAIGQLRTVPLGGGFVTAARSLGICLGD